MRCHAAGLNHGSMIAVQSAATRINWTVVVASMATSSRGGHSEPGERGPLRPGAGPPVAGQDAVNRVPPRVGRDVGGSGRDGDQVHGRTVGDLGDAGETHPALARMRSCAPDAPTHPGNGVGAFREPVIATIETITRSDDAVIVIVLRAAAILLAPRISEGAIEVPYTSPMPQERRTRPAEGRDQHQLGSVPPKVLALPRFDDINRHRHQSRRRQCPAATCPDQAKHSSRHATQLDAVDHHWVQSPVTDKTHRGGVVYDHAGEGGVRGPSCHRPANAGIHRTRATNA